MKNEKKINVELTDEQLMDITGGKKSWFSNFSFGTRGFGGILYAVRYR